MQFKFWNNKLMPRIKHIENRLTSHFRNNEGSRSLFTSGYVINRCEIRDATGYVIVSDKSSSLKILDLLMFLVLVPALSTILERESLSENIHINRLTVMKDSNYLSCVWIN
ncbi:hypothetical protein FRX31_016302 [Thalictrum thalictroides]|uniref:Uncharacterized protein n=1 Tax=Thalictrum thalictroides TaxID=46969 RepID=A0A7J6WBY5_THATH|nr:hypothetical protein FRX31_016302 [Thalictrum thalictroides]